MTWCNHAPLCKFINSVTKKDKVNNCSQGIHSITPYIDFEHIKGKENVLADSFLKLKTPGLYENNDPEKAWHEYGKSIFNSDLEVVCNADTSQNANQDFQIDSTKYQLDMKDLDDPSSHDTSNYIEDHNPFRCTLDQQK